MWLDDIKDYLDSKNLGLSIYELNRPDAPINCITLFEYEGLPVEQYAEVNSPGLQLWLRTKPENLSANYTIFENVINELMAIGYEDGTLAQGVTVNQHTYLRMIPVTSGILPLGKDDKGNLEFSYNFYVIRRK